MSLSESTAKPSRPEPPLCSHTLGPWHVERVPRATEFGSLGSDFPAFRVMAGGVVVATVESADDAAAIAALPDLIAALHQAVELVRIWHGMGMPEPDPSWPLYRQSPEMQRIYAALVKAGAPV